MGKITFYISFAVVLIIGVIAYWGAALVAIIYWFGANEKPLRGRTVIGIIGLVAIWFFVAAVAHIIKNGRPL